MKSKREITQSYLGALLGGAIGDAFGYPLRNMTFSEICERFEKKGALELAVSKKFRKALFTDFTQQTLFAAEGLYLAEKAEGNAEEINFTRYVFYALQQWLYTQTRDVADDSYTWLFRTKTCPYVTELVAQKGFYQVRSVNDESVYALMNSPNDSYGRVSKPKTKCNSYIALSRSVPAGLYFSYDVERAIRMGIEFSAITHGDLEAYLAAGCYAGLICLLIQGSDFEDAVEVVGRAMRPYRNYQSVVSVLDTILDYVSDKKVQPAQAISRLGQGHTALEALSIGLYSAMLHRKRFEFAIQLAANHDGASDACACVAGSLLGAYHGIGCIPYKWLKKLQYKNKITNVANRLLSVRKEREIVEFPLEDEE